jgi:hypothetical protein
MVGCAFAPEPPSEIAAAPLAARAAGAGTVASSTTGLLLG